MRCRKPARTSKTKHRQIPAREDGGCDASRLTLRTLLFSGLIIRGVNGIMIWDKDLQRTETLLNFGFNRIQSQGRWITQSEMICTDQTEPYNTPPVGQLPHNAVTSSFIYFADVEADILRVHIVRIPFFFVNRSYTFVYPLQPFSNLHRSAWCRPVTFDNHALDRIQTCRASTSTSPRPLLSGDGVVWRR